MKDFTFFSSLEALDAESKYLVHKAKEATQHAYAPYSKFYVGAALLLEDGTYVAGANQENASYPLCMCAERVALYTAASQYPGKKIKKIAVVAHRKNHKELVSASSCGGCRQVMLEYEVRQESPIEVVMFDDNRWIHCASAAALMPFSFDISHLKD
ncbi:MAG: cytidine deaminase [Cyclobacteriaceae bacterium]|nr:cytidine deaminase [Cyclobacteriaceae bacterium]